MPLQLVRKPRAGSVLHNILESEVRAAYEKLGADIAQRLAGDVEDWDEKPIFKAKVVLGKQWTITVSWDRRTIIGKIYDWVDKGTGERGGGQAYEIYPVNAKALHFFNPRVPIKTHTLSYFKKGENNIRGGVGGEVVQPNTEQTEMYRQHVHAPGIEPRNFIKSLLEEMSDPNRPGSFKSITDAAMKRAARKMGKGAK